ncbi:hypothetical protein LXL04_037176 [Taraxacum kok-saghyz]
MSCIETRRSTYGYSIFFGGNLVYWSAKKQPTIFHLLRDLNALPSERPTLLCDNLSAIFLSQNPIAHKRAKHIDIDHHFIRELVLSGKLHTKFVPTKLQVADIFTNPLPIPLFEQFRDQLRVRPPPICLRGFQPVDTFSSIVPSTTDVIQSKLQKILVLDFIGNNIIGLGIVRPYNLPQSAKVKKSLELLIQEKMQLGHFKFNLWFDEGVFPNPQFFSSIDKFI